MSKKKRGKRHYRKARDRNISIRGVRRDPPDVQKLSQALVALAMAQAEAEAQAEHHQQQPSESDAGDAPKEDDDGA